jgi:hypothetical protein
MASALQPPPTPPELPEEARPPWPWWYAPVGFIAGAMAGLVTAGVAWAVMGVDDPDSSPAAIVVGTLLLDGSLVAVALLFASMTRAPKPWHFGLRKTPLWAAVGWAVLGMVCFYAFAGVYQVVFDPNVKQSVAEDLGADQSTIGLIAAGVMIVCVAPFCEEFFFRGFFYGSLRTRLPVIMAATIDGIVFGLIHFQGGEDGLLIVPPLAALGFVFCLVYERTRSLFPVIALHATNNALAYAAQADGGAVSAVLWPLMMGFCLLTPKLLKPAPAPVSPRRMA